MMRQLVSPTVSDLRESGLKGSHNVFYTSNLEVTFHHFCYIALVPWSNPERVWAGTGKGERRRS